MTVNLEESRIYRSDFVGLNKRADEFDAPLGSFIKSKNTETDVRGGFVQTRPGHIAVTQRLFSAPFNIISGVEPWVQPRFPIAPPRGGLMRISAFPNQGLRANADNPQTVNFYVYLDAGLTIASFNWDFSYDGVTANVDDSGASTSTSNAYTTAGDYRVRVSGTDSGDSQEYSAEVTIHIEDYDNPDPIVDPIPPIDTTPPRPDDPEIDLPPLVNAIVQPSVIELGSSAELSWSSEDAASVTLHNPDGTTTAVGLSGTRVVTPTVTGFLSYIFVAENSEGSATASTSLEVVGLDVLPPADPGWLLIESGTQREHEIDFDLIVESRDAITGLLVPFPAGSTLIVELVGSLFESSVTFGSVVFNAANTIATLANTSFSLAEGIDTDVVSISARVEDTLIATPTDVLFGLFRPEVNLVVEIVDDLGVAFTADRIETILLNNRNFVTFFVKVSAHHVNTGLINENFSKDVVLEFDYVAGSPESPDIDFSEYSDEDPFNSGTSEDIARFGTDEKWLIPGLAFPNGDAGFATVVGIIDIFAFQGSTPDAHFVEIKFKAREKTPLDIIPVPSLPIGDK